ncbi:MAG TPA: hypothetical protein VGD89_00765 [Flavipsychrobacter sp.]
MSTLNTVAVLLPGVDNTAVAKASMQHSTEISKQEIFSLQKDYTRYFKPSWHIFHQDDVNLLFVFADGTSQLAKDADSLKTALAKVEALQAPALCSN